MEHVEELLCTADRKGRHDDLPAASDGVFDDTLQIILHLSNGPVETVAVRTLHHEVIDGSGRRFGIPDDQ